MTIPASLSRRLAGFIACIAATACHQAAPNDGSGIDIPGDVGVVITAPAPAADGTTPLVAGVVEITGTLAFDPRVTPNHIAEVEVVGMESTRVACSASDKTFVCHLDTAAVVNGAPIFKCNTHQTLRVTAEGTYQGLQISGTADAEVIVDNCAPVVTIDSPGDKTPFIGSVTVTAHVSDPLLTEAHLTVTDPSGASVLSQPVDMPPGANTWAPQVVVDRTGSNATEDLTITVLARDAAGLETQVVRSVTSVKRPHFLGSDQDVDALDPTVGDLTDFVLAADLVAFTDTPQPASDNLYDAVVGTSNGLIVRAGLPVRDATGLAIGAPQFRPSGLFDNPSQDKKLAPLRMIRADTSVRIVRVFLQDLDDDGDLDILAVGTTPDQKGVAWAVLNVTKTQDSGPPVRAFKLVDTRPLPAPPLSAELGDLNADGLPDLLVGAASPDVGLMTLLVQQAPMCTPPDKSPAILCGQVTDYAKLGTAQIFAAGAQTTLHKGVTGVSSIAVADFYQDDQQLNDVCVGETARGIISCYRNVSHDGTLAQAQDSYAFTDASDTHAIVSAEFAAAGGGPDLIVQSSTGKFVRWLTGDHNGGFKFVENGADTRNIYGLGCSTLGTAPVGPAGLSGPQYLTAISDTRKVTILPTQLDDVSFELQCFRAWVLGKHLIKVDAKDLNGDGAPDLVALDDAKPGLVVAFGQLGGNGQFNGNFIAPDAHHLCGQQRNASGYGVFDIAEAVLGDVDGDSRQDLSVIGTQGGTVTGETCPPSSETLAPVWTFAVFLNTVDAVVNPQPRMGEFAPYADLESGRVGCEEMGTVRMARTGDVDGDGVADLVSIRQDVDYFIGDDQSTCGCGFDESAEVDNDFGSQCQPIATPPGCTASSTPSCRVYLDNGCFDKPMTGYGGGARLNRAAGNVFLSSTGAPFGMDPTCRVGHVCHILPAYAFAAGLQPQGMVLADLNHDGKLDVATAMDARDLACVGDGHRHFDARVRVFQGDGTGKFAPASFGGPKDEIVMKPCDAPNETPQAYPVTYRKTVSGVTGLQAGIWPNPVTGKFDLSLFALGQTNGQVSWLAHTTGFAFEPAKNFPLGVDVKAFAVRDVNFDPHMQVDVLALLGVDISFLPGAVLSDGKTGFFDTKVTLAQGAQQADWLDAGDVNNDGFQDFVLLNKADATLDLWLGVGRSPTPLSAQFVHFPGQLRAAMEARDTQLADMDGDGCIDIVVRSRRAVTVLHNEGIGCAGAMLKP